MSDPKRPSAKRTGRSNVAVIVILGLLIVGGVAGVGVVWWVVHDKGTADPTGNDRSDYGSGTGLCSGATEPVTGPATGRPSNDQHDSGGRTAGTTEGAGWQSGPKPESRQPRADVGAGHYVEGSIRAVLGRRSNTVNSLHFTPDGRALVTAGRSDKLTVWDLQKGEIHSELGVYEGGSGKASLNVWAITPDGKTLAAQGTDDALWLWDLPTATVRRRIKVPSAVQRAAYTADGKTLFVLTSDIVYRYDNTTGEQTAASGKVAAWVPWGGGLGVTPDGKTVAVGGEKGVVVLLDGETLKETKRIPGHPSEIEAMAVSPDGKLLASVSFHDEQIKLYDLEKQTEVRSIPTKGHSLRSVAFSPSGTLLAVGGSPVQLYEVATGKPHRIWGVSWIDGGVVTFSPDGSLLAGVSETERGVVLWDLTTGLISRSLPRQGFPEVVAIAPGGARIALSTGKGLEIVSLASGKAEQTWPVELLASSAAAFSPDGSLVAYFPDRDRLSIVELATGKVRANIDAERARGGGLAFSADGKYLLMPSDSGIELHDTTTGKLTAAHDFPKPHYAAALSPDGKQLAVARGATLQLVDAQTDRPIWTIAAHDDNITTIRFSSDGKRILTASRLKFDPGTARLWDAANGKELAVVRHAGPLSAALFSADDKMIFTFTKTALHAHDAVTGKPLGRRALPDFDSVTVADDSQSVVLTGIDGFQMVDLRAVKREAFVDRSDVVRDPVPSEPPEPFVLPLLSLSGVDLFERGTAFSMDGKRLIHVDHENRVFVWALPEGKLLHSFHPALTNPYGSAASADGKHLAIGCGDGTIHLFDLDTEHEEKVLTGHKGSILNVAFSPDGKWLASGSFDVGSSEVFLWDRTAGTLHKKLIEKGAAVRSLTFASDSRQLLVGASGLHRFDVPSGVERPVLPHPETILAVAVAPDGSLLAAGGGDENIYHQGLNDVSVWDASGKLLHTLSGHDWKVTMLRFGPDGILTVDSGGWIYQWDAKAGKKIGQFRGSLFALSADGKTAAVKGSTEVKGSDLKRTISLLDVSVLRDEPLQAAVTPAWRLGATVIREGDGFHVDFALRGPGSIAALSALATLPRPLSLKLKDTNFIDDRGIQALAGLKTLHRLEANGAALTDDHLAKLAALPALKTLDLSNCLQVSDKGIEEFRKKRPNVKVIRN